MSKKNPTILIYDDEQGRPGDFEEKLDKGLNRANQSDKFDIILLKDNDFQNAIKALEQRRIEFRENKEIDFKRNSNNGTEKIDNASIFIIDYDLLSRQEEKVEEELFIGSLTGEIVAYLVRCFSKCQLIIGLNQYGSNPFDLTLRGDLDSFADVNLGGEQLDNSDLWRDDWGGSRRGYRPWSWPNLFDSVEDFGKRIEEVEKKLGEPICEVLGFDREVFQLLPREIIQFIGQYEEREPYQATFREFVTESGNGLRSKDAKELKEGVNDHILARVGAVRISKWLEQLVLPEQDILVDAPHLVSRYPSLITGDKEKKEKIETWNETARLVDYANLGLDVDPIEPYRFKKSYWISRPVWFWDKLRECEDIKEVTEPWLTAAPDWVFCEDASRFYNREDCREFLADTTSPFTQRFVRYFNEDEVDYRPRARFSL